MTVWQVFVDEAQTAPSGQPCVAKSQVWPMASGGAQVPQVDCTPPSEACTQESLAHWSELVQAEPPASVPRLNMHAAGTVTDAEAESSHKELPAAVSAEAHARS